MKEVCGTNPVNSIISKTLWLKRVKKQTLDHVRAMSALPPKQTFAVH
jgi:hypothetical protein